jgi:hypothetical protein
MLSEETLLFIIGGLGGSIAILALWVITIYRRLGRFMKGSSGASLEGMLNRIVGEEEAIKDFTRRLAERTNILEEKAKQNAGSIGVVRFNAFSDTGGNQSFATALLNEKGTGVLLSGISGRDRMSVYAKPVEQFSSTYDLSPEEKDAIQKARA